MDVVTTAERVAEGREQILAELRKVIVGQDEVVEEVLIALFTGGHCLITGVPGLAKTLLIKTLAGILDLDFKRIQFTPDLMPADITGTEILEEEQGHRRLEHVSQGVHVDLGPEQPAARQHLPENHAERKQVRPAVDGVALHALGSRIG